MAAPGSPVMILFVTLGFRLPVELLSVHVNRFGLDGGSGLKLRTQGRVRADEQRQPLVSYNVAHI